MYCKKCGKEMDDSAKICDSCGQSVEEKKVVDGVVYTKVIYYSSILCIITALLLVFSDWITIRSFGIESEFEALEGALEEYFGVTVNSFKTGKPLSVLGMFVWATEIFDVPTDVTVFLICLLTVIIVVLCMLYVIKFFRAGSNSKSNRHITFGYTSNLVLIVGCVIVFVLSLVYSGRAYFDKEHAGILFSWGFYIMFALLCINRFILLPKLKNMSAKKDQGKIHTA